VIFLVEFASPVDMLDKDNFIITGLESGSTDSIVSATNPSGDEMNWLIKVITIDNDTLKSGVITKIVGIKDSSDYKFCDPTINQAYNIRKKFLAEFDFAVLYDAPVPPLSSPTGGAGDVKIMVDESLSNETSVQDASSGTLYTPNSDYTEFSCHFYYIPNVYYIPPNSYYIYFVQSGGDKLVDLWENDSLLGIGVSVNERLNKQSFSLSTEHTSPVEISMIRPFPVIDKASAMIDVYQDGLLTATLYNLSGNKIATLLTAPATAGSKYDLNMRLGFLTNGVYTLIITLDDFSVTRTILISR
jgi:hypothetical protein